jgi:hypothetical protein
MAQLRISHMVCMEVLGKFERRRVKCALEALASLDGKVDPDEYLMATLENRAYTENPRPKLLNPRRPATVTTKCAIPDQLETMALLNSACRKSDQAEGLAAIKAIRERLNGSK